MMIKPTQEQSRVLGFCHTDRTVAELFDKVIDPTVADMKNQLVSMNLACLSHQAAGLQGAIQFAMELREAMKRAHQS